MKKRLDSSCPLGYNLEQVDDGGVSSRFRPHEGGAIVKSVYAPGCQGMLKVSFEPVKSFKKTERGRRAEIVRKLKKMRARIDYMIASEEST